MSTAAIGHILDWTEPGWWVPSRGYGIFGATKKRAVEDYTRFIESSLGEKSKDDYYRASGKGA